MGRAGAVALRCSFLQRILSSAHCHSVQTTLQYTIQVQLYIHQRGQAILPTPGESPSLMDREYSCVTWAPKLAPEPSQLAQRCRLQASHRGRLVSGQRSQSHLHSLAVRAGPAHWTVSTGSDATASLSPSIARSSSSISPSPSQNLCCHNDVPSSPVTDGLPLPLRAQHGAWHIAGAQNTYAG